MLPPDEDSATGEELVAAIFAIFASSVNPAIDREVAYDLLKEAMEHDGGLGIHNAAKWGILIRQTAHGVRSDAKH